MEFRCRLGTPGGEIIEGVYVADSEARLRREFEEKGLLVLAIQQAGRRALAGIHLPALPQRHERPAAASFSSSTRSWRRCSRPACRSCSRSTSCAGASPTRSSRSCSTTCTSACGRGARCRRRSRRTAGCFPASTRRRSWPARSRATSSRCCAATSTYVKVVSSVRRKTISALVYPAILVLLSLSWSPIIVVKVVPEFGDFYNQFGKELPLSTRMIVGAVGVRDVVLRADLRRDRGGRSWPRGGGSGNPASGGASIVLCSGCR